MAAPQPDLPASDLPASGRTFVVTGATSGIGRATAVALAGTGARLLLLGRDPARAEATLADIEAATGRRDVEMLRGDLSSQQEVRRLAQEILARIERLDVLVNNAGITAVRRETTVDGIERTFAVNHLAYFLLTGLLLPRLIASAPARIVNVASEAHRFGAIDWSDVQNERRFRAMRVYGQSKSANILFTRELARRLAGSGVTVNALHPGGVRTNLGRGSGPLLDALQRLVGVFLKSPEQGARTSIYLATSAEVEGRTGGYYVNRRLREPSRHARDEAAEARLWALSEELTGFHYPEPAAAPSA